MTLLFVLCIASPVVVVLVNLVRTGEGGAAVKEAMERRGVSIKEAAPIAPKVKYALAAVVPAPLQPAIVGDAETVEVPAAPQPAARMAA